MTLLSLFSLFSFPSLSMSPPLAFFIGSYTKLLDRLLICPRLRFHARRCAPARTVSHVSILPCSFLVCSSWQGEVTMWESATMMVAMTRPRELSCTEKTKVNLAETAKEQHDNITPTRNERGRGEAQTCLPQKCIRESKALHAESW
ncbi:hypothetical protein IWX50DRAFT_61185 [Phyllosticta citricarpa]